MHLSSVIIPVLILGIFIFGLYKKVDLFNTFISGARENLLVAFDILPALVLLMLAVSMFRESGAMEAVTRLISPLTDILGIPMECAPLAIMRPISGSGALSILEDIFTNCGPDSFAGKVASVLLGSTETTFYTVAVYFGATKVKNTRHALPSALAGDLTALLMSALVVRLFLVG